MSTGKVYSTEKIIAALEKTHGGIFLAAEEIGCSYKTIERRATEVKAVAEIIEKYSGRRTDVALLKFEQAINNGEPWALTLQLTKSKHGRTRGYSDHHEISAEVQHTLTVRELTQGGDTD